MVDVEKIFENLNTGVVAHDPDFKITYANEKYKQMVKGMLDMEGFVGNHMGDCHRPKTMEKIEKHFAE
jgi:PAS domain-containing protein